MWTISVQWLGVIFISLRIFFLYPRGTAQQWKRRRWWQYSYNRVASEQPQWKNHRIPYGLWHTLFVRHTYNGIDSVHIDRVFYSASRAFAVLKLKKKLFWFCLINMNYVIVILQFIFFCYYVYCSLVAVCTPFIVCVFFSQQKCYFFIWFGLLFFNN